ncbi:MAG: YceD family protein [Desulfomonilaceae bacterium]
MKIRIEDIPEEGLELNFSPEQDILSEALETIPKSEGISIDPHIKGHIRISVSGDDIFFIGTVNALMHLQCSRCLVDFATETDLGVNLVIRRGPAEIPGRDEREQPEADALLAKGSEMDPGELIVQELLLNVPMKPLCREDCPGLCPHCGALKGSNECTCPAEGPVDPRWEALAHLKDKIAE